MITYTTGFALVVGGCLARAAWLGLRIWATNRLCIMQLEEKVCQLMHSYGKPSTTRHLRMAYASFRKDVYYPVTYMTWLREILFMHAEGKEYGILYA